MHIGIEVGSFKDAVRSAEGSVARAATEAMRETTPDALAELRGQVISAGFGGRLANTWRDRVYPQNRLTMTPTGYIWSNAPLIIDSFVRGATIRPVNGARYLWIPTDNVPSSRGRVDRRGRNVRGGKMSPEEVENAFNADLEIRPGKNGTLEAFIDATRALRGRGFRRNTPGRRRQGRFADPVLMFILRRTVRMPKALDLNGPAARWAAAYDAAFVRRLAA